MNYADRSDRNGPTPISGALAALSRPFALLAALLLLALAPSAASAAQDHAFSASFGSPGTGAGGLSLLAPDIVTYENTPPFANGTYLEGPGSGLAVNEESGDVYVADTANHRIDEFGPDGAFIRAFGWEVDAEDPEAALQTCTEATGCQAGSSGDAPGQLETPVFVAVDNSCALHEPPLTATTTPSCEEFDPSAGDLYVADYADSLVTKFGPDGQLIGTWGNNGPLATPDGQMNGSPTELFDGGAPNQHFAGITVDRSGRLWVIDHFAGGQMFGFSQDGAFVESWQVSGLQIGEPIPAGLAVDSAGDFYVENASQGISRFDSGGSLGTVSAPRASFSSYSVSGLALDPADDDLYLDEAGLSVLDVSHQCEPSRVGCSPAQEFGTGRLSGAAGLAVGPGGTVYVADTGSGQIDVFPVTLEAQTGPATEILARSAVLHATVDPKGGEVTTCDLQFGPSTSYGRNLPCLDEAGDPVGPGNPITGTTAVQVHAEAEGLPPGAVTHFRVRARNGAAEELHSEDEHLGTLVLPTIAETEAVEVTAGSATLKAELDPHGPAVSSCRIEWGTSTAYGDTVPCEPASLPAGNAPVPVEAGLSGLSGETTYHWRLVAEDVDGTETGSDNTFVYLPAPAAAEVDQQCENEALREADGSTALPDCRAYEMVTPPHKNGSLLGAYFGTIPGLSADGSRLIEATTQCFPSARSCGALRQAIGTVYEFERTPTGWTAHSLAPAASQAVGATLWFDNADRGNALYGAALSSAPSTEGREWLYASAGDGAVGSIGPVGEDSSTNEYGQYAVIGATADLSHVVYHSLEDPVQLWPSFDQTFPEKSSLYEYAGPAEHPFLVAVNGERSGNTELIGRCGAELGTGVISSVANSTALSADGRTVYFTVQACPAGGTGENAGVPVPAPTLYARIDGEGPDPRTVEISAPAPAPACDTACRAQAPAAAEFQGASTDGSEAYFTSTRQLTDDATEGSENLYLYRDPQEQPPTGDHLTDVSAGDTSGQGPQVQGVMAISPDGSHVYFVARGLLAGRSPEGSEPVEGAENLYVYDAGEGTTRFVATLSAASFGNPGPGVAGGDSRQWAEGPGVANVTPDGDFLLFTSHAALTADATRPEGPAQVYRYDAPAEELTRVSIGRRGFADDGNAGLGDALIVPASQSLLHRNGVESADPSISDDGTRAFFESPVGLTPAALDDVPVDARGELAENVYEWEQDGAGPCTEAGGCVYLISDGRDAGEGASVGGNRTASSVELIGTDRGGEDVFFTTVDPLVPADTDTESDVYDARVGGGFAPPVEPRACASSETCHGQGTQAGAETSPASSNFDGPPEGPGSVHAVTCRKGQVKKNGRCVGPKAKKKHRHHKPRRHRRATARHHGGRK